MDKNSKYFNLFSECILVKGSKRSVIYDLPRNEFKFIPNTMHSILNKYESQTIEGIKECYPKESHTAIDNYFSFLIENDFIFFCDKDELELFPKLDLEWDFPSKISNVIIDINEDSSHNFKQIFSYIEALGCKDILLRNFSTKSIKEYDLILEHLKGSRFKSIDIITKYPNDIEDVNRLITKHSRLRTLIFHSAKEDTIIKGDNGMGNVVFRKKNIKLLSDSYLIDKSYFNINITLLTESQAHHTYFNRKLYIGGKGEIKNTPECEEEFGNIQDLKDTEELNTIIAKPEFQKYWFVHKELCEVCKDCEFRHMCVDNRLPYQRTDSSWYHKLECNYNPYICKWQGEEGYQTLEGCAVISNENGFLINHEKITEINKILWEKKEVENA
jgi:SPASM domain peptide maturase of grasp-with-spasm system